MQQAKPTRASKRGRTISGDVTAAPAPEANESTPSTISGKAESENPPAAKVASVSRNMSVTVSNACDPESFEALPLPTRMKMRAQLRKCEQIIKRSRAAWQGGAKAFVEIRDNRLYRAEGFTDFGQYCKERLEAGKSTVNRQIALGEVNNALASTGAEFSPTSERQIRPLLILREPKQEPAIWGKKVAEVWAKAVHDAKLNRTDITEKSVLVARKQLGFDPQPKTKPPEADFENRWAHLKSLLEHQRELCPVEHRSELRVRIASLINGWESGDSSQSALKAATAPKTIDIAVELVQADTTPPPASPAPTVEDEPEPED